jgi:sucrose-6-phosphate hydrolase SacC (GH32 family)
MRKEKVSRAWVVMLSLACALAARGGDDIVIADFEGSDYGAWTAEGEAFGTGPAEGTLANQQKVSGFLGKGLVNTYLRGDNTQGRLTSPEFVIERKFINFLVGGGDRPGEAVVNLVVEGKVVKNATGRDEERLDWATWDVSGLAGKRARIQIVDHATGGWGHINVDQIVQSDVKKAEPAATVEVVTDRLYEETYRPQFHFTAKKGWLNDPNGMVFQDGAWHLFFQHNPLSNASANKTWGQAVSKDLVHWEQLGSAIEPDAMGDIWSGTAVIDHENTAGFGQGAMVCIYTAAGGQSAMSKGKPFTQCIAYSTDNGRTVTKWSGNPVLKQISPGNRDPKVFWHGPTKRWVMALWVEVNEGGKKVNTVQFFSSPDLKEWTYLSRIDGFFECPDLFELPVDGDANTTKWVMYAADGNYILGQFDGKKFTKEAGKFKGDYGANFYAAQTFNDAPEGRRVLIGWMVNGRYPGMPFTQQMTFPVELSLRTTGEGVRLFKWPVKEISSLVVEEKAGEIGGAIPELADVTLEFVPKEAGAAVTVDVPGALVMWKDGRLSVGSRATELKPVEGKVSLRVLVDRTSVEVFANGGAVTMSSCYVRRGTPAGAAGLRLDGTVEGLKIKVSALKSAWK